MYGERQRGNNKIGLCLIKVRKSVELEKRYSSSNSYLNVDEDLVCVCIFLTYLLWRETYPRGKKYRLCLFVWNLGTFFFFNLFGWFCFAFLKQSLVYGWPEMSSPYASASQMLGLQVCASMLSLQFWGWFFTFILSWIKCPHRKKTVLRTRGYA